MKESILKCMLVYHSEGENINMSIRMYDSDVFIQGVAVEE